MKSNLNNLNNENPPTASASDIPKNPCFSTARANITSLVVFADDGHSYCLAYAQFLFADRTPNPALEKSPDALPEQMLIHFVQAEIVILGSGLKKLEDEIQQSALRFVKSADRRLAATFNTHLAAVTLTLTKENI